MGDGCMPNIHHVWRVLEHTSVPEYHGHAGFVPQYAAVYIVVEACQCHTFQAEALHLKQRLRADKAAHVRGLPTTARTVQYAHLLRSTGQAEPPNVS